MARGDSAGRGSSITGVTRGTRFAHLGMAADGGGGWRRRGGSVGFEHRRRQAPVKMKAPKGAAVFGDPSGTIDSAQAVAHRCGGELHTTARVSTIVDQNSS
jgi:hypothetical protein